MLICTYTVHFKPYPLTQMKQLINRETELFYTRASEETRLDTGMGVFEFERIKTLIEEYLSTTDSIILDIGGGTGKYSEWLSKKGHQVHLVEPVEKHLRIAEKRSSALRNSFSIHHGAASKLPFPDNYADFIILHGPLYHLDKEEDREKAIREAKRVLKSKGILLGFAISYTASTLVGLLNGLIHKKTFFRMCQEELQSGTHIPPDDFQWLMPRGHYHKPEQLKSEFTDLGLTCLNIHAVEGMAWLDKDFFSSMLHPRKKSTLLKLIQTTETDEYLLPFSPHIMIATQK